MKKKQVLFGFCGLMTAALLSGCSGGTGETASKVDLGEGYPMSGDVKLQIWCSMDGNIATVASNYGETPFGKAVQEQTGATVEFLHPSGSNTQEAFNILVASDDMPDIIEYNWQAYSGGLPQAYRDGFVQKLDDYKEYAPDFFQYLEENPDINKAVVSDEGEYYGMPAVNSTKDNTSAGLIIRKDWLEDLNLEMPNTIDEYYNVLKAFRDEKNAEVPFSANMVSNSTWGIFSGAFGVERGFYIDDGKVVYGPAQAGYKDYLALMNKWYNEKLLDNNFSTLDLKTINSNMLNGFSGLTTGSGGSNLGLYNQTAQKNGSNMKFAAAPTPVLNEGERAKFGQIQPQVSGVYSIVTKNCKNPEAAVKYLNYAFTDEGHMLYNFGIEGESYVMENGEPQYTELITDNPDGLPMNSAMGLYMRAVGGFSAFVQDTRVNELYYRMPEQQEANVVWRDNDAAEHLMPVLNVAPEQQSELTDLWNEISNYSDEMFFKYIMGTEDLSGFDAYVQELNNLGLPRVLEIYQQAYDKYMTR